MRILKFGGKSLDSIEKCTNICKFIKKIYKQEKELIIVVSAIGNETDRLLEKAEQFGYNYSNVKNSDQKRELARLLSTGENQSASLLAIMLSSYNVPAKSLSGSDIELTTFGDYLCGKVAYINKSKITNVISEGTVAVISGFQGINCNREITTLGRGGSDTTAVAISTIFDCDVEIYSDYNGVFTGDPKINKFKKIKNLNFDSLYSMSESGAKVFNYRAVSIAKKFNKTIISKCSADPMLKGTIISSIEDDIVSISSTDSLCNISIIFSNENNFNKILKYVIKSLINYKIYNLTYKNNKIEVLIDQSEKVSLINDISKRLNLLTP